MKIKNCKFLWEARAIVNDKLYQFTHIESEFSDWFLRFNLIEWKEEDTDITTMPVSEAKKYGFIF